MDINRKIDQIKLYNYIKQDLSRVIYKSKNLIIYIARQN